MSVGKKLGDFGTRAGQLLMEAGWGALHPQRVVSPKAWRAVRNAHRFGEGPDAIASMVGSGTSLVGAGYGGYRISKKVNAAKKAKEKKAMVGLELNQSTMAAFGDELEQIVRG